MLLDWRKKHTEAAEWQFGLSDEQKSPSFHQSFVKYCQRIMLLPSKSHLLGYNMLVLRYGYHPPLPINFSKYLLIAYCVPETGDLTVSKTQSLLTFVCVHACKQTNREIRIMKIERAYYVWLTSVSSRPAQDLAHARLLLRKECSI